MDDLVASNRHAVWTDSEELECVSVLPEVPNTASFTFRAVSGALFDFQPGQFMTLELPLPDGVIHRTYTISSSPSRPRSISITVKAQPDSIGTRWMLDHLVPGTRIRAMGPAGQFTLLNYPAEKYLFISAGSGITPMMSMTTWMFDHGTEPDIVFINCARRPSEILFRGLLEHMATRLPGLYVKWVIEEPERFIPWTGFQGRFNQLLLGLVAPDYLEREVFCCGPEPFMHSVRDALSGLGYDMDHYHQESFQAPVATEAEIPELDDVTPDGSIDAEIVFAQSQRTERCTQNDTVLAVTRASGLNIPSGCTFGVCGTCRIRKLEGEVHMVHNGGISEDDIAEGYILACCSYPMGKVTVDV
ncbi:2Fe-2S iron-sulfur cluster-binding protein [Granulosicoccus sp. 3-233]|uniref:2Fe-2S iron-sulfur cluster-binding protein n=1 Tax=Granulosicoccus sp. 3-233 TaxID=3417969 RepID=UPI003D3383D7